MTNQRHTENNRIPNRTVPDPSVPATHVSIELPEDTVLIYDRENPRQWIWADEVVHCADHA